MQKTCIHHGELEPHDIRKQKRYLASGEVTYSYKCRLCHRDSSLEYVRKKDTRVRSEYKKQYDQANKARLREKAREYREKNREDIREKKRQWDGQGRAALKDRYIIAKLTRGSGLTYEQIRKHPELIELKRTILLIKRKQGEINETKKHSRLERPCIENSGKA